MENEEIITRMAKLAIVWNRIMAKWDEFKDNPDVTPYSFARYVADNADEFGFWRKKTTQGIYTVLRRRLMERGEWK